MQNIKKKYFLWKYSFEDTEGIQTYTLEISNYLD